MYPGRTYSLRPHASVALVLCDPTTGIHVSLLQYSVLSTHRRPSTSFVPVSKRRSRTSPLYRDDQGPKIKSL